jgi:hypothetical protein
MWRAALFDAILRDVKATFDMHQQKKYSGLFRRNVESVSRRLSETLNYLSGGRLDSRAPTQIATIVHDLGILALEMGSQRAHVYMETCKHGDRVRPGDLFRDESDSMESDKVDLMTQPCVIRVGDGREDLNTMKVIVKGDFVPLKSSG